MASAAQAAASRANGALSHGPTSEEGKATSSLNILWTISPHGHGALDFDVPIGVEDPADHVREDPLLLLAGRLFAHALKDPRKLGKGVIGGRPGGRQQGGQLPL